MDDDDRSKPMADIIIGFCEVSADQDVAHGALGLAPRNQGQLIYIQEFSGFQ